MRINYHKVEFEEAVDYVKKCLKKINVTGQKKYKPGVDFEQYSQNDITLMMNHINSYSRESLGNKSPYEVFRFLYGDNLLNLLGCTTIPAEQIILKPSIFKKEVSE